MDTFTASWLRVLRRRWKTGLALFVIVAALGSTLLLLARPIHRAESRLRLGEAPPMGGVSPAGGVFGMLRLGGDAFANDLELLSSRTLAEGVVDDAVLHVRIVAPRGWHRDSLVHSLTATRETLKASYTVAWLEDGSIAVTPESVPGDVVRGVPGDTLAFGGVSVVFRAWRERMPRRITLTTVPHAQAARVAGGRFTIERTRRDANVVRVAFQDADPRVAHEAVAAAVRRFIALRTTIQRRESGETVDSLRTIAAQTAAELARAEEAFAAAQRSTGIVAAEAQAEAAVEQYADVSARLELARMELGVLDGALRRAAGAESAAAWSALLSYPRFLENETLAGLLQDLSTLEQQRRELALRRTAENPELRAVLDQIEYLDQSLRTIARDYRDAVALQLSSLESQVALLGRDLGRMPASAMTLARRQRDARILAEVVVMTEQRLRQEQLRQALTFANVQVIDPPALRDRPVWPRPKLGLLITLILAGGTALLGMAVVERADNVVRSAADVRALLGVPVLAVVHRSMPLSYAEVAAIVRRGGIEEPGRARVALAAVRNGRAADAAAAALRAGAVSNVAPEPVQSAEPELTVLHSVDNFAAAATAAALRTPVVMVIEAGVTSRQAAQRTAALLQDAGADIAGVVMVCGTARTAGDVWA